MVAALLAALLFPTITIVSFPSDMEEIEGRDAFENRSQIVTGSNCCLLLLLGLILRS